MDTKVITVGSSKVKNLQRRSPRIRLSGFWLDAIGFSYNSLVTVSCKNGSITLTLQGTGIDTYSSLVKHVRQSKSVLLQVRQEYTNKKQTTYMELKGFWLSNFGFDISTVIVLQFEQGVIHLKALDLERVLKYEGF